MQRCTDRCSWPRRRLLQIGDNDFQLTLKLPTVDDGTSVDADNVARLRVGTGPLVVVVDHFRPKAGVDEVQLRTFNAGQRSPSARIGARSSRMAAAA